jgi:hypothetical protein
MHWVYVLQSSESKSIYVGETIRLYRRWWEHNDGKCKTTCDDTYDKVIGLYNVSSNYSFIYHRENMVNHAKGAYSCQKYWGIDEDKQKALELERHITERYIVDRGVQKCYTIYGSFYLNDDRCENFYFSDKCKNYVRDRPLCNCGYPCEVKMKQDKTKIYFTCPVPDWIEGFDTDDRCKFYQEFEPYRKILECYMPKQSAHEIFGDELNV